MTETITLRFTIFSPGNCLFHLSITYISLYFLEYFSPYSFSGFIFSHEKKWKWRAYIYSLRVKEIFIDSKNGLILYFSRTFNTSLTSDMFFFAIVNQHFFPQFTENTFDTQFSVNPMIKIIKSFKFLIRAFDKILSVS